MAEKKRLNICEIKKEKTNSIDYEEYSGSDNQYNFFRKIYFITCH